MILTNETTQGLQTSKFSYSVACCRSVDGTAIESLNTENEFAKMFLNQQIQDLQKVVLKHSASRNCSNSFTKSLTELVYHWQNALAYEGRLPTFWQNIHTSYLQPIARLLALLSVW